MVGEIRNQYFIPMQTDIVKITPYNIMKNPLGFIVKLYELTLPDRTKHSNMRAWLDNTYYKFLLHKRIRNCTVLIVVPKGTTIKHQYSDGYENIIGWAIVKKSCGHDSINLFVDPKYRRQGIGTKLYKKALSTAKKHKLLTFPHDKVSENFFKSFGAKQQ